MIVAEHDVSGATHAEAYLRDSVLEAQLIDSEISQYNTRLTAVGAATVSLVDIDEKIWTTEDAEIGDPYLELRDELLDARVGYAHAFGRLKRLENNVQEAIYGQNVTMTRIDGKKIKRSWAYSDGHKQTAFRMRKIYGSISEVSLTKNTIKVSQVSPRPNTAGYLNILDSEGNLAIELANLTLRPTTA